MKDYYLKFESEAQAQSILYTREGVVEADPENNIEANEGYDVPKFRNIDTIGIMYEPTGELDDDEMPVMAPIPGWHVNIRVVGEDTTDLEPFVVVPTHPRRVFA
jgi:hypothetical protein